jgi:hypothetical protein
VNLNIIDYCTSIYMNVFVKSHQIAQFKFLNIFVCKLSKAGEPPYIMVITICLILLMMKLTNKVVGVPKVTIDK